MSFTVMGYRPRNAGVEIVVALFTAIIGLVKKIIKMKLILVLFLFFTFSSIAQSDSTKFQFTHVDSVKGTKAELYVAAKSWLANYFNSSKDVIDMEDKEAGKIIGNAIFEKRVNSPFGNRIGSDIISYTITIDVKDDKYRIVLSSFTHKRTGSSSCNGGSLDDDKSDCGGFIITKKQWDNIKEYVSEKSEKMLQNMQLAMAESAKSAF